MEDKEKFCFIPVSKKKRIDTNSEYTASITRSGVIRLNVSATRELIGDCKFVRVFLDTEKRTIALQFKDRITPDKNWRTVWKSKGTGGQTLISAANVTKALGIKGQNFPGLPMKEYEDSTYGKVVYFKVPKWNKTVKEENNEENK